MLCQHVPREEFGFSFTCDLAFLSVGERQRGERVERGSHMFSLYTTTVAQCSLNNTSVIHLRVGEERFHWLFGPDGLLAAYYTTPTAPERGPILSHLGIHLTLYISTWSRHYFSLSFLFFLSLSFCLPQPFSFWNDASFHFLSFWRRCRRSSRENPTWPVGRVFSPGLAAAVGLAQKKKHQKFFSTIFFCGRD